MKPKVKKLWVKALRSEKYKQGHGHLRVDTFYCCMGVLCDLHAKANKKKWKRGNISLDYDGGTQFLSGNVMLWAGLENCDPFVKYGRNRYSLSNLNDGKKLTFPQIADIIEKNL